MMREGQWHAGASEEWEPCAKRKLSVEIGSISRVGKTRSTCATSLSRTRVFHASPARTFFVLGKVESRSCVRSWLSS